MHRNRLNPYSLIALALVVGLPAAAQSTTGNVQGKTQDGSGKALGGVVIVFESPALFQPRTIVSDAKGNYRAPLLPVGTYNVKVSKDGYLSKTVANYRVGVGAELALDFSLKAVSTAEATVEVTASGKEVEASASDRVAYNVSAEQMASLPVARNFAGAAFLMPGVSFADEYNGTVAIRGADGNQTQYRVDGVDVKSDYMMQPAVNVIPDTIEDVQITLSTGNARFGRVMGGAASVTTKKGGNEFSGSIRQWYVRSSWPAADVYGRPQWRYNDLMKDDGSKQTDVTFSGPIWKDHIWFALATRISPSLASTYRMNHPDKPNTNRPALTNLPTIDEVTSTGRGVGDYHINHMDADSIIPRHNSRSKLEFSLTAALNEKHTLTLTNIQERKKTTAGGRESAEVFMFGYPFINKEFWGDQRENRTSQSLNWRGLITDSWVVEATASRTEFSQDFFEGPQQNPVPVYGTLSDSFGNTWSANLLRSATPAGDLKERNTRYEVNFKGYVDWHGSHDIDLGVEYYMSSFNPATYFGDRKVEVGGWLMGNGSNLDANNYRFPTLAFNYGSFNANAGFVAPVMTRYWVKDGDAKTPTQSAWVNDSWTINNHWVVMAGLRYNHNSIKDVDGTVLAEASTIEPRFSVRWDLRGTGVDTLSFSANRQGSSYTARILEKVMHSAANITTQHGWRGIDGQPTAANLIGQPGDIFQGQEMYGVRWATYNQLIDTANYQTTPYNYADATQTNKLDANYKPQYMTELSLNYRRNYKRGYVTVGYTHRIYANEFTTYQNYGNAYWGVVKDPSNQGGIPKFQQITYYTNSPEKRVHRSFELSWMDQITTRFGIGGNYTYSWGSYNNSVTHGNWMWSTPAENWYSNLQAMNPVTTPGESYLGSGPSSNNHNATLIFSYVQPVGKKGRVTFSLKQAYYTQHTGTFTYSKLQEIPFGQGVQAPAGTVLVDDFAFMGRLQTVYREPFGHKIHDMFDMRGTDLKIDWDIPLVWKVRLIGGISIRNIWNENRQGNQYYTGDALSGDWARFTPGYRSDRTLRYWPYHSLGYYSGTDFKPSDYGTQTNGFITPRGVNVLDANSSAEGGFSIGLKF